MHWSIQQIARLAGTTSRTLRHYGDVGLLDPTRIGDNGYRYYDTAALVRLQRILLLRELGLALPTIGEILDGHTDDAAALTAHLHWLRSERRRLLDQITSVETTITKLNEGEMLMAEEMLNGFDHTQHRAEVEERWGTQAYASGDTWWRAKSADEKAAFQRHQAQLAADWADAAARGLEERGVEGQGLARRQYDWLAAIPGTPGYPVAPPPTTWPNSANSM